MLNLRDICKIYRKAGTVCALRDVSLAVGAGEYLSVVGSSGSGKTTLMHILGLLDRPTSGEYRFRGQAVDRLSERERTALRAREIGFVFQDFHLSRSMTALENAALPLLLAGVGRREREARAAALLEGLGLGERLSHLPQQLSGGQQQRVAVARALITGPSVLLADEPTGNLDPQAAEELLALFDRLHARGHTIVLITHDRAAAARAGRCLRMEGGRLEE